MSEKLLPIVPGCLALVLPSHLVNDEKVKVIFGTCVTIIERDYRYMPEIAWRVDSEIVRKDLNGRLSVAESNLMRIDGHEPEAEDVNQSKTLERVE